MRFHPPIHAAVVAVTVVAGLASYQGVDKLVLAKGGATYGTPGEPGHDPSSTTSTTAHHDHSSTTLPTTGHHEPTSPPSTTVTVPQDPGTITSTTMHHETPRPSTSTTIHYEPPPSTAPPTTTPRPTTTPPTSAPPTTVALLSFGCWSGFTGDQWWTKCGWSQSKLPNFDHYVLTRELVGAPRQVIFQTSDRTNTYYIDGPQQPGAQYSYMIGAFDAAGNLIGQGGGPVHLTCCGGGVVTP
jgi:hypothetical protein